MVPRLIAYGRAVSAVGALVQSPRWDDDVWRQALAQQISALHTLQGELAEVKGVPKGLEQAHGAILSAGRDLEEAFAGLTAVPGQGPGASPELLALVISAAESLERCVAALEAGLVRLE